MSHIDGWRLFFGAVPSSVRAMEPIRTAPAVWELDGPTITGPRISKMSIKSSFDIVHFMFHSTIAAREKKAGIAAKSRYSFRKIAAGKLLTSGLGYSILSAILNSNDGKQ